MLEVRFLLPWEFVSSCCSCPYDLFSASSELCIFIVVVYDHWHPHSLSLIWSASTWTEISLTRSSRNPLVFADRPCVRVCMCVCTEACLPNSPRQLCPHLQFLPAQTEIVGGEDSGAPRALPEHRALDVDFPSRCPRGCQNFSTALFQIESHKIGEEASSWKGFLDVQITSKAFSRLLGSRWVSKLRHNADTSETVAMSRWQWPK